MIHNFDEVEIFVTLSFAIADPYALWLAGKYILDCVDRYMKAHFFSTKKILKTHQVCIFSCLKKNSKKNLKTSSKILLLHSIQNFVPFRFFSQASWDFESMIEMIFDSKIATGGDREFTLQRKYAASHPNFLISQSRLLNVILKLKGWGENIAQSHSNRPLKRMSK